jgi:hypothetical protein
METYGLTLKAEIGRDMAPFAGSVLQAEATAAWQAAVQSDTFGAMQIPEVAESVWAQVQNMVGQGQAPTAKTVANLRSMFYMEHCEKTGVVPGVGVQPPQGQQQQLPPPMSQQYQQPPSVPMPAIGGLRYPGAGAVPHRPPVVDPNAPKYSLDAATSAALQTVFGEWNVKPKAFQK